MSNSRQFIDQNPTVAVTDAFALWLAIREYDEIPVRQLLREFESAYPVGYGKQMMTKMLPFLSCQEKEWLRELY